MRVVVTGAGRGIGRHLAELYRAQGHEVIGTARDGSSDVALDVAEPAHFSRLADALGDGPLDLLICNAGIYADKGQPLDTGYPSAMWAETFAVNVTGVFLTVQAALPALRRAERAKIGILSSQMASSERAPGGSYIYRASKAAVLNLGRNLATDLKREGIAVGIYHPGWVRTDMGGGAADVAPADSAQGLADRMASLSVSTTGAFETWDGRAHPM